MSLLPHLERHARLAFGALVLALVAAAELFVRSGVEVRNVGASFSEFHPRFLRALKPGVSLLRETPEFRMRLTTNSLGMRGPEPRSEPAPWRKLLFVGDSFTMGYGVEDGQEFPRQVGAQLEVLLGPERPVAVWNAGVGNSGTARLLRYLEENPHGLDPDLTVYQFCENDFEDNLGEGLYRLDAGGRLVALAPPGSPGALRRVQGWLDRIPLLSGSHLFSLARQALTEGALVARRRLGPTPASAGLEGVAADPDELTYALLEALVRRIRELGSEMIAVSFDVSGERRRRLEAILRGLDVPHLRLASKAERPEHYYRTDGHWSPAGHRHAAERLAPRVASALVAGGAPR